MISGHPKEFSPRGLSPYSRINSMRWNRPRHAYYFLHVVPPKLLGSPLIEDGCGLGFRLHIELAVDGLEVESHGVLGNA